MASRTATGFAPAATPGRVPVAAVIGLSCLCGIICFALSTRSDRWFLGEDGVVEWASATMFGMAAALAMLMVYKHSMAHAGRALMLIVAALGTACFLSEVSFGARLMNFSMPAMPGGGELDGGQDFVMLAKRYFHWIAPGQWMLKATVLAIVAATALFVIGRFQLIRRAIEWQTGNLQRKLVLAAAAALTLAVSLDTFETRRTAPVEELSELLAAALLVASTLTPPGAGVRVRQLRSW